MSLLHHCCIYTLGPNDLSLFQPKCPETSGMASRLFIYYHAKSCRDGICINLSPSIIPSSSSSSSSFSSSSSYSSDQLDGHFAGQHYVTRDIKVCPGIFL